ncbi:histidine kinase [Chitinophaga sp. 22321]|uniref:Histidine kinase n=1 Tax=Chitinophaga hostae TaxID=2831022 RepID=A0ABS5J7R5_9BACT|nr:histidine kinase [Chitinophaga hostae]MBS0031120.1 histidine kinase [Chitinophaga hostae]
MRHNKPYRYLVHLAVCMALILLYCYPQLKGGWASPFSLKWTVVRFILFGFINFHLFYLLVFGLLQKPVQHKQYGKAILYTLAAIIVFSGIKYAAGYFFFPDQVLLRGIPFIGRPKIYMTFLQYLPETLKTGLAVALLAYGYRLLLQWRNTAPQDRLLATAAAQAGARYERMQEGSRQLLHYLQQLTPVLENEQTREKQGTKAILLLSDLLRYMLYDKALEKDKVSFKKELLNYERYLALRRICHPQQLLTLQVTGEDSNNMIEALRLQDITERSLQELAGVIGEIVISVHVMEDSVALSVTPVPAAVSISPNKIKLYPEYA